MGSEPRPVEVPGSQGGGYPGDSVGLWGQQNRCAVEVMKAGGLYGQVKPPSGPADAELVLWEKAKEWALAEFKKKGPSEDPLLDLLVHDTEVVRLTRQRMEELAEAQADKTRNEAE